MIDKIKKNIEDALGIPLYYDQPIKDWDIYTIIEPANLTSENITKDHIVCHHYYLNLIITSINKESYIELEDLINRINDYMLVQNFNLLNTTYQKTDSSNIAILSYVYIWEAQVQ